jgi:transaldolase
MTDPLTALTEAGVSIWLDDLSRDRLTSGSLADLVAGDHVSGVTTNPTIIAKAIATGGAYELRPSVVSLLRTCDIATALVVRRWREGPG